MFYVSTAGREMYFQINTAVVSWKIEDTPPSMSFVHVDSFQLQVYSLPNGLPKQNSQNSYVSERGGRGGEGVFTV